MNIDLEGHVVDKEICIVGNTVFLYDGLQVACKIEDFCADITLHITLHNIAYFSYLILHY